MLQTAEPQSEESATTEQRPSKALPLVLSRLSEEDKTEILDLGAALSGNVRFFSPYPCRLHIADLFASLLSEAAESLEDPEADFALACRRALDLDREEMFDLIFAWDIFDYLRLDQIQALATQLVPHCRETTVLFALASYHKQIPARPGTYELLSRETLRYRPAGVAVRTSPQHKEPDLARALQGFEVEQSFLLRHGQHEYIFAATPGKRVAGQTGSDSRYPTRA
jgi:hypothetical protein